MFKVETPWQGVSTEERPVIFAKHATASFSESIYQAAPTELL